MQSAGKHNFSTLATGGEHRVARGKTGPATGGASESKGAAPTGEYPDDEENADGDQQPKGFGKGFGKSIGKGATGQSPALNPLAGAAHQFTPDSKADMSAVHAAFTRDPVR